jgi:hypothetical protein
MSRFLAGKEERVGVSGCPDGVGNACNLGGIHWQPMTYHQGLGVWLDAMGGTTLRSFKTTLDGKGEVGTFATLTEKISSMVWNNDSLYYCSSGGILKKYVPSSNSYTNYNVSCFGVNLLYKEASGTKPARLVFPYSQNGLHSVAEYFLD